MGISQYELAERLKFSRGQIANYEQGTREPDFYTLGKIADFFQVSTDYLLGRSNDATPTQAVDDMPPADRKYAIYIGELHEDLSEYEAEYLKETLQVLRKMNKKPRRPS